MNKLVTITLAIGLILIPLTSFALWNCELEVANDEDTGYWGNTEPNFWGYDPCVVGDLGKDWLEKQGLSKDKYDYYSDCRSIRDIADKINGDQNACYIGKMTGSPFNLILFQTTGFGDPNYQSPSGCGDKSEAVCLWENYDIYNSGYQQIKEAVTIGEEDAPRTIAIAGYNVFMPTDRGEHYTCMGDPENKGSCDHFANGCKGGSFGPMCPDNWAQRLIENEVAKENLYRDDDFIGTDEEGFDPLQYPKDSPIHPANWKSGGGGVTIFAGSRSDCPTSLPCGSYSILSIDTGKGKPAFVVKKGSTLILRDLLITLKSGRIEVKGTLIMTNVVFNYANDNSSPESAITVEKGGAVHLTDPNKYSESDLLKSNYQDHGKFQFGITRFIMPAKLFSSLEPDFSYIKISNDVSLKTNDYNGEWVDWIMRLSTTLPDGYLPVATDKKVICSISLDSVDLAGTPEEPEDDFTPVGCKDNNGKVVSIEPNNECLNIVKDEDKDVSISRAKPPVKKKYLADWWGKFYDLPLSTYICADQEITFKPACSSKNNYVIKHGDGSFSCDPLPTSGNGWVYNENKLKFDCDGLLTQDNMCITECPYGMEYSKETNTCTCKAGKSPHTITYWFRDDDGNITPDKKLDICCTQCPEGKINTIDTFNLKISATVGETIYSFTPVFTVADKCTCPEGLTDSTLGCIDVPAKQKECNDKNASAVHGSFLWKGSDFKCAFNCETGFIQKQGKDSVCVIKCDEKGKTAAPDGNSCMCDTMNNWMQNGADCKCKDGYTVSGNACIPDNDPAECSQNSDCGDDELCKDGECVDKDEPKPLGDKCKSDSSCGTGMVCSSVNGCECDIANNWTYESSTGKCEYREDDAVDTMCKLNGGTYITKEAYCEYNKSIAACKISGGTWDEIKKSCSSGGGGGKSGVAGGCASISGAGLPDSLGSLLPYLLLLSYVSLRARRAKQSPASK